MSSAGSNKRFCRAHIDCPDDAEDLAHEVFLAVCKRDLPENPEAYIYAVARNLVNRHYRDEEMTRQADAMLTSCSDDVVSRTQKSAAVSPRQFAKILANLDVDLSAKTHEAIKLRFIDGLSCEEAARRIGCSKGALYKRLQRGKMALKDAIRSR